MKVSKLISQMPARPIDKPMPDKAYEKMIMTVAEVADERKRQFVKWGEQTSRTQTDWVAIAGEEFGEVAKEVVEHFLGGNIPTVRECQDLRKEWIQLAAVCVQAVEMLDKVQRIRTSDAPLFPPDNSDLPF